MCLITLIYTQNLRKIKQLLKIAINDLGYNKVTMKIFEKCLNFFHNYFSLKTVNVLLNIFITTNTFKLIKAGFFVLIGAFSLFAAIITIAYIVKENPPKPLINLIPQLVQLPVHIPMIPMHLRLQQLLQLPVHVPMQLTVLQPVQIPAQESVVAYSIISKGLVGASVTGVVFAACYIFSKGILF